MLADRLDIIESASSEFGVILFLQGFTYGAADEETPQREVRQQLLHRLLLCLMPYVSTTNE